MKSLKIGHVDLDTSHPGNWVPVIRDLGHEVVGVYDGGTIYDKGYAREFADEHEIPEVYESLEVMAKEVDVAIIHACNWDLHVERARPFIAEDKGILIDKPMVGSMKDLHQLLDWHQQGHRVYGGSSLKFCEEVEEFKARAAEERGEVRFVFAGCAVDEFNYGIHAYSMLHGLMGSGVESVKHLGTHGQRQLEIVWETGKRGILTIGEANDYLPFYATVITDISQYHLVVDNSKLYRALLETALPYLGGESKQPVPLPELLEVEKAALAARMSWMNDNKRIYLTDVRLDDEGYDGFEFAREYRRSKR